jgi:hypothetical protein
MIPDGTECSQVPVSWICLYWEILTPHWSPLRNWIGGQKQVQQISSRTSCTKNFNEGQCS